MLAWALGTGIWHPTGRAAGHATLLMPHGLRGLRCRLELDMDASSAADHAALLASAAAARLKGGETLLHQAARAGQLALLRQLVSVAPEAVRVADDRGRLPLHVGSDEAMVLLLVAAPDTATAADYYGKLSLHEAVRSGANRAVCAVIDIAPEAAMMADVLGELPLHVAARVGNADAARLLLAAAPQAATTADVSGRLPLHSAAPYYCQVAEVSASAEAEIVQLLLAAAPQAAMVADNYGRLPLHRALDSHAATNEAVLQLLLAAAAGAAMVADQRGWLPLHHAALGGREAIVRALLATAAHAVLAAAGDGRLPLHWASSRAAAQLMLAAAPATAMVHDAQGRLPVDVLLGYGWVEAACAVLSATETHAALAAIVAAGEAAVPLFAVVACQQPLSSADWELVPTPCPGLAVALPAVARRSGAEAGQLVRRLLPAEQQRLRASALCLSRFLPASVCAAILVHVV